MFRRDTGEGEGAMALVEAAAPEAPDFAYVEADLHYIVDDGKLSVRYVD